MHIRLAVFIALIAACSFPPCCECFAQTARPAGSRDGAAKTEERAEFKRRMRAEILRLKAESPDRYVESADFAVDPQAYADKRVVAAGKGDFISSKDGKFTMRIADSRSTSEITADFSQLSAEKKKALLKIDFPPHLFIVAGVWRKTPEGWRLFADEIRDFGEASLCGTDCLEESEASSIRAGQDERLSRVGAELQRLKTETPRRYVENAGFNADPRAHADKKVVAVGFGFFSSNENGVFTMRIADSYGGAPAITADFSQLSTETKKALFHTVPPHVFLVAGVWRKTAEGWRLFAEEARNFGEARCGATLADCLKALEDANRQERARLAQSPAARNPFPPRKLAILVLAAVGILAVIFGIARQLRRR